MGRRLVSHLNSDRHSFLPFCLFEKLNFEQNPTDSQASFDKKINNFHTDKSMELIRKATKIDLNSGADTTSIQISFENHIKCLLTKGILLLIIKFSLVASISFLSLQVPQIHSFVDMIFIESVFGSFIIFVFLFLFLFMVRRKPLVFWLKLLLFVLLTLTISAFFVSLSNTLFFQHWLFVLLIGITINLASSLPAIYFSYGTFNFRVHVIIFLLFSVPISGTIQWFLRLEIIQLVLTSGLNLLILIYVILDINFYIEREAIKNKDLSTLDLPLFFYTDCFMIMIEHFAGTE